MDVVHMMIMYESNDGGDLKSRTTLLHQFLVHLFLMPEK